jgi:hypothetical protein
VNVQAIAPVLQRIAQIEGRFDGPQLHRPAATGRQSFDTALLRAGIGADLGAPLGAGQIPDVPGTPPPVVPDTALLDGALVATSAVALPVPTDHDGIVDPTVPFAAEFEAAGRSHGVPPRLLAAVGWVESRYQTDAVSPDGALGLMQIMPMTANELGVDPTDPIAAIDGAARLLRMHHDRFGSWDLALAAYHSGGGAVARAGNQAPPRAAEYVARVHRRLEES